MSEIVINIYEDPCHDELSHRRKHHAAKLGVEFSIGGAKFKGENIVTTLPPGQSVRATTFPLKADGSASLATLSGVNFQSSDVTVFNVVMDTTDPTGSSAIISAIATADSQATLSFTATATEPDGITTEQISGSDQVFITAVPPPVGVAASLGVSYGTPFPTGSLAPVGSAAKRK